MAVAKRTGPDFLFLANANSKKFDDLKNKETCLIFHDSNENWISVTGEAVTTSNDDPRIKEVYSKVVSAWFGDLGDGVHTGGPEDPRMTLIEIRSKCKFVLTQLKAPILMSMQTSHTGRRLRVPSRLPRRSVVLP